MPRLEYMGAPGQIFFNNEAADVSLHGTFTDADHGEVWDDSQIRDFIRGGRPDLFNSLQKLPVPPEGLPQPVDLGSNHLSPDEHILMNQSALIEGGLTRGHYSPSSTAQHHHAILYRTRTIMLQHKRHIQSRLLSGHDIFLRHARKPGCLLLCSAPDCHQAVGHGGFFITLCARSGQPDIHYGLDCLEKLFDSYKTLGHATTTFNHHVVDGAADDRPVMPFDLPSNSVANRRLRQQRTQEIEDILREVETRQEAYPKGTSPTEGTSDVRIRRPKDLGDINERYKKQRLTLSDQKQEWRISRQQQQSQASMADDVAPAAPADEDTRLICYCREPENDSDLVQCSNEFCLIGWFHADCCAESPFLLSDRRFYCDFCTDRTHESDSDTSGEIEVVYPSQRPPRTPSPAPESQGEASEVSDGFAEQYPEALPTIGGFTPINPERRYSHESPSSINLDGSINPRMRPVINYHPASRLNANLATFADLAPFISYKIFPASPTGLTEHDVLNFEAWRYSVPISTLATALSLRSGIAGKDLPKGPREDLRKLAKRWVDRLVFQETETLETSLTGWFGHKFSDRARV